MKAFFIVSISLFAICAQASVKAVVLNEENLLEWQAMSQATCRRSSNYSPAQWVQVRNGWKCQYQVPEVPGDQPFRAGCGMTLKRPITATIVIKTQKNDAYEMQFVEPYHSYWNFTYDISQGDKTYLSNSQYTNEMHRCQSTLRQIHSEDIDKIFLDISTGTIFRDNNGCRYKKELLLSVHSETGSVSSWKMRNKELDRHCSRQ